MPLAAVRDLVAELAPADDLERAHQADALAWLSGTDDIYRRRRPATPPKHLVSYTVLADPADGALFLIGHRLSGLTLPPGGHVEPGEDPAAAARRETAEELGLAADFSITGPRPLFVTVTRTNGRDSVHTDVSLWYVIAGDRRSPIRLDEREFTGGRWWTPAEIEAADPARFDPHLARFAAKLGPVIGRA